MRPERAGPVVALVLACHLAAPTPARAADGDLDALEQAVARYAAGGRSDVRLHLSPGGEATKAQTVDNGDGTSTCRVSGLQVPAGSEPGLAALRLAALVVHETTHCLLDGHAVEPPSAPAALLLLRLTQESIADARSVIEIARRDGATAARRLVDALVPWRRASASPSHETALALLDARDFADGLATAPVSDGAAFAAAITIGRAAAERTLQQALARDGRAAQADGPSIEALRGALDRSLSRARDGFVRGRYANDAFTLRRRLDAGDPGDRHVYLQPSGPPRRVAVLGAEGAHDAPALAALLERGGEEPAHTLALRWLRREGQLDAAALERTRQAIARLLPPLPDEAHVAWAVRVFEQTVDDLPGRDPAQVLEEAAGRLRNGPR